MHTAGMAGQTIRFEARLARACRSVLAAVIVMAAVGCAQMVPQTMALRTGWPGGVPQTRQVEGVPFFPQDEYQCGPAALATVLAFTGVPVTPEPLVPQVYVPARRGSLQLEMLAAARRHGRVSYVLAPRFGDLLREVAAGHPVLVLQDMGALAQQWHYAVVNGFDYPSGTVYLRSGTVAKHEMSFTAFERSWMKSGYWAMVVTPPDRIPATATEDAWVNAVLALARVGTHEQVTTAFATALERWPENLAAAVGLANQLHARGSLAKATEVLREARLRHPDSAIVANNLAQVLSDQGQQREALSLIEQAAADPSHPFASEIRSTRQAIVERIRRGGVAR